MKRQFFLALAACLCLAHPARAAIDGDTAKIEAREKACLAKDETDPGMKACTAEAYNAADRVLGDLYRSVVEKLKKGTPDGDAADNAEILKRLVSAERAWIAFRDADCDLQGTEMLGGTGEGLVIEGCLYETTKQRIKSLDDLFNGRK